MTETAVHDLCSAVISMFTSRATDEQGTEKSGDLIWVSYDMIEPFDAFGKMMRYLCY